MAWRHGSFLGYPSPPDTPSFGSAGGGRFRNAKYSHAWKAKKTTPNTSSIPNRSGGTSFAGFARGVPPVSADLSPHSRLASGRIELKGHTVDYPASQEWAVGRTIPQVVSVNGLRRGEQKPVKIMSVAELGQLVTINTPTSAIGLGARPDQARSNSPRWKPRSPSRMPSSPRLPRCWASRALAG